MSDEEEGIGSDRKQRDIRLIRLVGAHPSLYDASDKDYRCTIKRDKIWKKIAAQIGGNSKPIACKRRWANIRDTYRKAIKRRNRLAEVDADELNRAVRFEEELEFMARHLRDCWADGARVKPEESGDEAGGQSPHDISYVNTEELQVEFPEMCGDSSGSELERTNEAQAASEIHDILQELVSWRKEEKKARNDHLGSFFKSIEQTVRNLPLHGQIEAKKKISALVFDLELSAS